jgi:hypothetical protein
MLRFHIPLIEPDVRFSGIRLSDKDSCLRTQEAASDLLQLDEAQRLVQVFIREAWPARTPHLVFPTQPPTKPIPGVGIHGPVGFTDRPQPEAVRPSGQHPVE